MERKERQQANADENQTESSKLIREWKSTPTLLFLFPSILGVKERGKVTTRLAQREKARAHHLLLRRKN